GLLALAAAALTPRWRRVADLAGAGWLLACALVVLVAMTVAAKKQDRYALPAVPLLAVAAAVGLRGAAAGAGWRPAARAAALGAVGLAQLALCAAQRPYYLSFYSPL